MTNIATLKRRDHMGLFTDEQLKQLYQNGQHHGSDHIPVAYLVQPELRYQWLVTELYHDRPNVAYGLFFLNEGKPNFGEFDLTLIEELNSTENVVFNNPAFQPSDTLAVFKLVSEERGFIVSREEYNGAIFEKYRKLIY